MSRLAALRTRYARFTRRERGIVAVALLTAIVFLGYSFAVEPALRKRALLEHRMAGERVESAALVAALAPGSRDPNAELRSQLSVLQNQLGATDREFAQIQNGLVQPQHMGALLRSLLTEHRGLKLLGLRTLPVAVEGESPNDARKAATAAVQAASAPAGTSLAQAATAGAGSAEDAWLFRHGVEIKVQGTYADMTAYLQAIENLPRKVHWGGLEIDARHYPASVMTVTIYTVSLERSWWVL